MSQMELASPAASSAPRQEAMMVTADGYSYKPGLAAAAAGAAPPSFQFQQQHQHHHPLPLHGDGGGDHDKCHSHVQRKHGSTGKDGKLVDAKTERRLAQNREAARKSRLRKKAYVQQLETTRIRLQHVEHEFQRARSHSQGVGVGGCGAAGDMSCGAAMFDMEYARWLDDDSKRLAELRGGLQAHLLLDANLGLIVEECMQHHDELFQLKAALARSDVFHLLTGSWTTPAERCFFWMGGFRPSELLKVLIPQLDPLTEQQLLGICSLQQSSEQAEEALAQGLHQLHQALADTVAAGTLNEGSAAPNCMNIMAVALDKIASLENFYQQADNLRQQTLHQMRRILTTRQAARCFLSIGEYYSRLRALSNLWASRPGDTFIRSESLSPTATELQALHHQRQNQFSGF
ncbi:liguleless related sequence1 [Zea mays]|nr:liguleless related sequence1 [Zea mays]